MLFKYAIALTGSISTGKSTVVGLLKQTGFHVIDADSVAHEVLDEEHQAIAKTFGDTYVNDGKVERKSFGMMIFSNPEKRKMLEALLHPLIYARIEEESIQLDKRAEPYVVDIPLFFEGGRYAIENVIVVYATKAQQLQRLMDREEYSEKEALLRINAQIDIDEKRKNASYIINNSGDLSQLHYEVERIREQILGDFK